MSNVAMADANPDTYATSKTLVHRLKNPEDQDGWSEFCALYSPLIREVARKYGLSSSEADEVLQETLIKLSQNIGEFDYDAEKGSFKKWLLNMVKWRIVDQKRERMPQAHAAVGEAPAKVLYQRDAEGADEQTATINRIPDPGAEVEQLWDQEWKKTLMEKALQRVKTKVKAKHYQIFDLYVVQQWPVSRVVSTLGVNFGQVYLARHRVGSLLKKELKYLESSRFC